MKKKIAIITVIVVIIAVVIIKSIPIIGFLILATKDDCMGKEEIIKYVTQNHEKIEAAVSDFINENPYADGDIAELIDIPKCDGIKTIYFHKKEDFFPINDERIQFECGGYGLGSATGYAGFYYSLSGTTIETNVKTGAANMSFLGYYTRGAGGNNYKFIPNGEGWRWKEVDGDNTVYIEHIVGDFYYYLEEY